MTMRLLKPILYTLLAGVTSGGLVPAAQAQLVFVQQGSKFAGTGAVGAAEQGYPVAISADGNTAVVGGVLDNNEAGAAWIFTRSNSPQGPLWSQQGSKLVGSGAVGAAQQATSVAISGDGNTVMVGGPFDNNGAGAVWVFTRANAAPGTPWTLQGAKLVSPSPPAGSYNPEFGFSVSLSADGNTAIVGEPGNDSSAGAAWIFTRTGGVWTQQGGKLVGTGALPATATIGAEQGYAVAISGDGNTATVAAPEDNNYAGAIWIFTRTGSAWSQQSGKLAGTGSNTLQGWSVALSTDGNTALVGGWGDNIGLGAAWVFTRNNGTWSQQGGKLVGAGASGLVSYQGWSVALSGDGNTAAVGGPADAGGAVGTWIFKRSNGAWSQLGAELVGTGASGLAEQGKSVAISGDGKTLMVGGPFDSANTGASWVFVLSAPPVPAPAGISPAAGSGTTGTFTFTFSDTAGWQNLLVLNALIRDVLDGRQACYVAFVPTGAASGAVLLIDDAGAAAGPYAGMVLPAAPPGPVSVSNSQCSITAAGSSAAGTGNTFTLTLAITFTPGFAGNKVLYVAAQDTYGNSGWQPLGTWGIPGAAITGPAVSGMSPGHGNTSTQTYTFTFTDTNGFQDITVADVLVNSAITGVAGCYVAFVPSGAGSGAVYLVDNAGDAGGPYSGMLLPGSGTVSNGQCSIAASGSSVSGAGNTLTLMLAITFNHSFTGNQIFYLAARSSKLNSNWQAAGSVAVP